MALDSMQEIMASHESRLAFVESVERGEWWVQDDYGNVDPHPAVGIVARGIANALWRTREIREQELPLAKRLEEWEEKHGVYQRVPGCTCLKCREDEKS